MITKQQALEFIYELSKEFKTTTNLTGYYGSFMEVYSDTAGTFHFDIEADSLEELVTKFIAEYINTNLFENIDIIPIDVGMLEAGQTYKVEFLDFTGVPNSFTEKLLSVTEEDKPVFNFSNSYYTKYIDIKEIYKVNSKDK